MHSRIARSTSKSGGENPWGLVYCDAVQLARRTPANSASAKSLRLTDGPGARPGSSARRRVSRYPSTRASSSTAMTTAPRATALRGRQEVRSQADMSRDLATKKRPTPPLRSSHATGWRSRPWRRGCRARGGSDHARDSGSRRDRGPTSAPRRRRCCPACPPRDTLPILAVPPETRARVHRRLQLDRLRLPRPRSHAPGPTSRCRGCSARSPLPRRASTRASPPTPSAVH